MWNFVFTVSFLILSNLFTFPSTWNLCSTSCGDQGDGGFGPWNQDTDCGLLLYEMLGLAFPW